MLSEACVSLEGGVPLVLVRRKDASSFSEKPFAVFDSKPLQKELGGLQKTFLLHLKSPHTLFRDEFTPGAQNCRNIKVEILEMHLCKKWQVSDKISCGRSCCCVAT